MTITTESLSSENTLPAPHCKLKITVNNDQAYNSLSKYYAGHCILCIFYLNQLRRTQRTRMHYQCLMILG